MAVENFSKTILSEIFETFSIREDISNKIYLERYINYLEQMEKGFKLQSEDKNVSQLVRARARDLEQNCIGLINGIKFGISFFEYKDIDLLKRGEEC